MQRVTAASARIAVAGCGHWGANLVRNFAGLRALAAVVDSRADVAASFANQYGVAAQSWQEALTDPEIQAVAIASPAEQHARMVEEALAAGKHVFIEKPLALRHADGVRLVAQAEKRGLVLMVGHLLHYHAAFIKLRALVRDGALGRLRYIYSNRLDFGKVRREENILWSFAPHDISMILSLAGELPDSVHTEGSFYLQPAVADTTVMHLHFAGGVDAHVYVSWLHPFKEQKLVVIGDKAMAVFDDGLPWADKLTLFSHSIDWIDGQPEPRKAVGERVELVESEPLRDECQHFLNTVKAGGKARTDGAEGLNVLAVLEAGQRSLESRASVSVADIVSPPKAAASAAERAPFVHALAAIDEGVTIGKGTKIWHFAHVLKNSRIGENCVIGQNVSIGRGGAAGGEGQGADLAGAYLGRFVRAVCGLRCT